jgi:hypothetical protein
VVGVIAFQRLPVTIFMANYGWILEVPLAIGVVTDGVLALSLCYYLNGWRGDGFER